jgi:hypothetical protein
MMTLEQLQPNAAVRGLLPDCLVTVVSVRWFGSEALELTYKTPTGKVANELLYRHDEPRLELVEQGRPWSFDGDGALFRLVSEAGSASVSRTCSIQCWRFIPPSSSHCRTRSRPSTSPCFRGSRFDSYSLTIRAPARPLWPGFLSRN